MENLGILSSLWCTRVALILNRSLLLRELASSSAILFAVVQGILGKLIAYASATVQLSCRPTLPM